jgi:threonyl-tRNA synthetase
MKIPYILIVGQEELGNQSVSIRDYKTKEQSTASKNEVLEMLVDKRDSRSL